jgi:hypothetical protein
MSAVVLLVDDFSGAVFARAHDHVLVVHFVVSDDFKRVGSDATGLDLGFDLGLELFAGFRCCEGLRGQYATDNRQGKTFHG